jgi:uncharacterized lipoprotein YbaY
MAKKPLVHGEIVFGENPPRFDGATVYVRLEDTALMDAPSRMLTEHVIEDVSYGGAGSIDFTLDGELPTDKTGMSYTVSAHVSMDGTKDIAKDDYITKQAYPVLRKKYPDDVTITVEKV